MKLMNFTQDGDTWLNWRKGGVGGSDVPVIMNASNYEDVLNLWMEKVGRKKAKDLSHNPHVKRGKQQEPEARAAMIQWLLKHKGRKTDLTAPCAQSEQHDFIRVSYDGLPTDGIMTPCELKCPSERIYAEVDFFQEQSPTYLMYRWQLIYQMMLANADTGYLAFYLRGKPLLVFEVLKQQAQFDSVFRAVEEFWQCVVNDTPPKSKFHAIYEPAFIESAKDWLAAHHTISQAKKKRSKAEKVLKQYHANSHANKSGGSGVEMTSTERSGSIDYKKAYFELAAKAGLAQNDAELMAEKFRKDSSTIVSVKPSNATDQVIITSFNEPHAQPFSASF
ncbi:lambda-exonuclease family protein [Motilimonas pumila]|uniref:YqaJ viral recombinase domain-containing protein n=1 Tax=Motilimonas pumila TaxID=2303987 RepID=A0A418YA35_9GAMM|nr:YqaJ viral recombinase family protein [Motilimonas pumila]RJG38783.1 hypothetical protein D1Z90_18740 [Motilimonas pumila]